VSFDFSGLVASASGCAEGECLEASEARVSIFDHGLLDGDGPFAKRHANAAGIQFAIVADVLGADPECAPLASSSSRAGSSARPTTRSARAGITRTTVTVLEHGFAVEEHDV
jgi:branched-subunit amino acid aminotransferase/4-amino-4-deoxychorismate lyase